jgi:hypothetical protein
MPDCTLHAVGWVEARNADTHRLTHHEAPNLMGIAALNPSYSLDFPYSPARMWAAIQVAKPKN